MAVSLVRIEDNRDFVALVTDNAQRRGLKGRNTC